MAGGVAGIMLRASYRFFCLRSMFDNEMTAK